MAENAVNETEILLDLQQRIATLQEQLVQARNQAQGTAAAQVPAQAAGQGMAAARTPLKPDKPSNFSGERGEAIDTWIFEMERHFRLTRMHEEDKVEFATTYLKKSASSWGMVEYNRAEESGNELNWEQFKMKIRKRYRPKNAEESARDRLGKLRQTGSVAAYSHAFRTIMQELPDMHEGDAMHYFKKGLKEAVGIQVGLQRPTNLEEAEEMADTVDSILFEHRNYYKPNSNQQTYRNFHRTPGGSVPMEIDSIRRSALNEKDRDRLRKEGRCFYCREGKHLARDCPERKKKPRLNAIETIEAEEEESGKEDPPSN